MNFKKEIIQLLEENYKKRGWPWLRVIDICNSIGVSKNNYQEELKELLIDGVIKRSDSITGTIIKLSKHEEH